MFDINKFKANVRLLCEKAKNGGGGDTAAAYNEGYTQGKEDEYKRLLEARATGAEPSGDIVIEAEAIAQGAFAYCKKVKNVVLTNAVTLNDNAFYSSSINSILMPKVETIGGSVFYMNRSIVSVTLPATLKNLGTTTFGYTTLKSVTFEGTPESIASNAFTGSNSLTDIYVPWAEGEVANAPWGAKATIHYNTSV